VSLEIKILKAQLKGFTSTGSLSTKCNTTFKHLKDNAGPALPSAMLAKTKLKPGWPIPHASWRTGIT
jgi:hypothetical protein